MTTVTMLGITASVFPTPTSDGGTWRDGDGDGGWYEVMGYGLVVTDLGMDMGMGTM